MDCHAYWAAVLFGGLLFVLVVILACWLVGFMAYSAKLNNLVLVCVAYHW